MPARTVTEAEAARRAREVAEVRAYLESHPGARSFDVQLECHMTAWHAAECMRGARGAGQ